MLGHRVGSRATGIYKQVTVVLLASVNDYSLGILSSWKCKINTNIPISDFKKFRFFLIDELYGEADLTWKPAHLLIQISKTPHLEKRFCFLFF